MSLLSKAALKGLDIHNSSFLYGQRSNHASSLMGCAEIGIFTRHIEASTPRFTRANETRVPWISADWQHCVLRPLRGRWIAGGRMHHGSSVPPGHRLSGADRKVGGRKLHLIVHLDHRLTVSGFVRAAVSACLEHGQNPQTQQGEPSTAQQLSTRHAVRGLFRKRGHSRTFALGVRAARFGILCRATPYRIHMV